MMKHTLLPIALMLVIVAGPLAYATTTTTEADVQAIQETQTISTQHLTSDLQQVNGLEFTPRWGSVVNVDAKSPMVLFADCNTDEFAVSGQFIFPTADIVALQSFAIALPSLDTMSWLTVVENRADKQLPVSNGVICADQSGNTANDATVNLDDNTKTTINNIVKQFIKIENNQIVNLNQIINVYQNITQNAIQIVNITGNNNTVTQIINQSASQIVATNGTNIGQTINQTAQQQSANVTTALEAPTAPVEETVEEEPTLPINETSSQPELLMPLIETPPAEETTTEEPPEEAETTGDPIPDIGQPTNPEPEEEETTTVEETEETETTEATEEPTSETEENPEPAGE